MRRGTRIAFAGAVVLAGVGAVAGALCLADSSLRALQRAGTIRVGYAVEAPYAFVTPDGEITGESPEMAKRIVGRLGIRSIVWRGMEFRSLIDELEAGNIDLIASGLFVTPERARRVAFSKVTFHVRSGLLVAKGNPKKLCSCRQVLHDPSVRLAVLSGSVEERLYSADELLAMKFTELTHPDDRQQDWVLFDRAVRDHSSSYNNEKRYVRKDGSVIWVRLSATFIRDGAGTPVRSVAVCEDITARKQAEAERENLQNQLIQAQKMESVGRLAGGVAHDFNNMLGVILGYTQVALEGMGPSNPLFSGLEQVQKASERAAGLTRQLLAFARRQTIIPQVLDLNETVEGMLKMLHRLIGEDIDLAWQPMRDLWPVKMDPSQVDQLLANLCVNARDAIADVGKVTIETQGLSFDEDYCRGHVGYVPGDYVLLAVSDNGCGMDKKTQEHIFEPFFTTKEAGMGTGLGLSTVYGIIQQNSGFINVYSEPGKGTTFKIYLPRYVGPDGIARASRSLASPPQGHGETVLVVEDDPALLDLSVSMLKAEGYAVLPAAAPEEAVRLAEEHVGEIQMLLTDVVLPGMNGRELESRVRLARPAMRTLFMSGYTANVIAHHGVLDAGVEFLAKPFSKSDLAAKVRSVLDSGAEPSGKRGEASA